jgi:hypothetical protein
METTIHSQRASKKPSEVIDSDLSKLGSNLITKFHVLMRISQIYDSKNVALHQFIQESLQTIALFGGGIYQFQISLDPMEKEVDRRDHFQSLFG